MAVDDYACRDTNDLVLPKKRIFPTKIPISHWQLRHYISLPEPDHLYYATGSDVWCLNPSTQKRTHVAYLPFEARCTASGYGWICVGGEDNGDFAAIRTGASSPAEIDALLPLDFGLSDHTHPSFSTIAPRVKVERIGEEIVNSVSVHRLPALEGANEEVVAVLTNNDKTVRIYSLTHLMETTILGLSVPVNHATISPDGQILVAVGDAPRAYFFERIKGKQGAKLKSHEDPNSLVQDWQFLTEAKLHCPREATSCCYFSTAWSPSGTLCALGSECGYISVFERALLERVKSGEDAVVRVLASSRPKSEAGPGAIRTMLFAPEAWDLLVWSEDSGRVCIGDLRTGLRTKQTIHLNHQEEGLEKLEVTDTDDPAQIEYSMVSQEADFIRRYRRALDADDTRAAAGMMNEYITAPQGRRDRIRQASLDEDFGDDPHGLTSQERAILEALRTTRQREEARNNGSLPRSINYTSGALFDRNRPSVHGGGTDFPTLHANRTTSTAEQSVRLGSLHELLQNREINSDRPPWQPRRRSSIILSDTHTTNDASSTNPIVSRTSLTSHTPESGSSFSAYNATPSSSSSMLDSWRAIEASTRREREQREREARESPSSASRPTYSASNLWDIARDVQQTQTSHPSHDTFSELSQLRRSDQLSNEISQIRRLRDNLTIERDAAANRPLTPERFLQLRQEIQEASLPRPGSSTGIQYNHHHHQLPHNYNPDLTAGAATVRRSPSRNPLLASTTSSSHLSTARDTPPLTTTTTVAAAAPTINTTTTSSTTPPVPLDPSNDLRRIRRLVQAGERAARHRHQAPTTTATTTTSGPNVIRLAGGGIGAMEASTAAAAAAAAAGLAGRANPEWGVRTAGLAMSADGRMLYVGSEEGVWEVRVDVAGRRFCPAVEVR
ncbi:MAG: hypothetical protein M1822_005025 [Bathelium mastoideum]|nr:MAG: hypothetical protein M1822_005025 [Bathelium mastoideum]